MPTGRNRLTDAVRNQSAANRTNAALRNAQQSRNRRAGNRGRAADADRYTRMAQAIASGSTAAERRRALAKFENEVARNNARPDASRSDGGAMADADARSARYADARRRAAQPGGDRNSSNRNRAKATTRRAAPKKAAPKRKGK